MWAHVALSIACTWRHTQRGRYAQHAHVSAQGGLAFGFLYSFNTSAGEMSDASEVLYTLYEAINGVAGARSPVDAAFGLRIKEGVRCTDCGQLTHQQARRRFSGLSRLSRVVQLRLSKPYTLPWSPVMNRARLTGRLDFAYST